MHPLIDQYLVDLARQTRRKRAASQATLRATRADLQQFVRWWEVARALPFNPALVLDKDMLAWTAERQMQVKASTLNRARSTFLGFFDWAQAQGLTLHNPAAALPLLPRQPVDPPRTSPQALDWLIRAILTQTDRTTQQRDLALLSLLSDAGLRSQEAASIQLGDLDLDGATLMVRQNRSGRARCLSLSATAVQRLRAYLVVRCPLGLPPIGSAEEQQPLLMARRVTHPGRPWEPGMQTITMRKVIAGWGRTAAALVREQMRQQDSSGQIGELERLAHQLEQTSPHRLRHGLAYRLKQSHTPLEDIGRLLGHSKPQVTTSMYGKAFEEDIPDSLDAASRCSGQHHRPEGKPEDAPEVCIATEGLTPTEKPRISQADKDTCAVGRV